MTGERPAEDRTSRLRHTFRALAVPAFRIYWIGQWVSVTGTWMQSVALAWLVYSLTSSPLMLGLLTAARFGPSLAASPLAGVLTDRWPRRRIVLATQAASLVQASSLAALTLSGHVRPWQLLALALVQGVIDTLDMPARQTLQVDLVGVENLQSAVSLNSAAFNVGRMVGPALAGWLVAVHGEGVCFAVNAASYLAVLVALASVRVAPHPGRAGRSISEELRAGFHYAWHHPVVRRVLAGIAVTSGVGLSYTTILPALVREEFGADARGYGLLLAGAGVGALVGSLLVAARREAGSAQRMGAASQGVLGCGLIVLGSLHALAAAVACMFVVGIAVSTQMATTNGFLQTSTPGELRGRIIALYTWLFAGMAPLGGVAAGAVAERLGAGGTAIAAGALCLVSAAGLACEMRRVKAPLA